MSAENGRIFKRFRINLILGGLISLAGLVRLYQLGKTPLWMDEAITYYRAILPVGEIVKTSYHWDVHPPTYYLIMHGIVQWGQTEAALRLFSVACGVFSVILLFIAIKKMHSLKTACLSAFLLTVSLHHVRYSQEARVYALFFLISLLSIWAFYSAAVQNKGKAWILWAVLSVFNFYVHYFALLLMAAQGFYFITDRILWKRPNSKKTDWKNPLLASGLIILGCIPQLTFFIQQAGTRVHVENSSWHPTNPIQFFLIFVKSFCCPIQLESSFWDRYIKYGALLFLLFGIITAFKRYHRAIIFHGMTLVFILVLSYAASFFVSIRGYFRYLIFANFSIAVLFAFSIQGAAEQTAVWWNRFFNVERHYSRRLISPLFTVLIVSVFGLVNGLLLNQYYQTPRAENWRLGTRILQETYHEGDVVVPIPCFLDYQIKYYLRTEPNPPLIERMIQPSIEQMKSYCKPDRTVFFVLSVHLSDPALKTEIRDWVSKRAVRIWQDTSFPETEIWAAGGQKQTIEPLRL